MSKAAKPENMARSEEPPSTDVQNGGTSLTPLVALLFACILVFHLGGAAVGKSLIRASHLGTALEYARGPLDLLRPTIVGFNATGTPTAQELPIWQAAAGLAFKLAGSTWYGWANLVSLIFFATGLWPMLQLGRLYAGERAAWWGLAFFLAQPLIVVMAGEAAVDGMCLVLTIWFLFFADKLIRSGNAWWWLPTTFFACLSAVTKLPFFVSAGLASIGLIILNNPRSVKSWFLLAAAGVAAGGALVLWTSHADSLAAMAEYPYYELRLSRNRNLALWFFGDLHSRLALGLWVKGGWRFMHATLGALPFVGLLLIALVQRGQVFSKLWLTATFLVTLIFTPLVLNHWHYYLMSCPAVALLCGVTLARWEGFLSQQLLNSWSRLGLAFLLLIFSAIDGLIAMKIAIDYDYFPEKISQILREHTTPGDKLIICGEPTWGGEVLFRAGRKGLSVYDYETLPGVATSKGLKDLLGNDADLRRLKALGYTKVVLLSESPVRFAVQASNPGSKRQRLFYPESISKEVDAWPVVYRTEDILILKIP